MIDKLELHDFKNIKNFDTELKKINILIGENNSGKSSVLQGIHFSMMAEVIRRKNGADTVRESELLYLPSSNVIYLRHNQPYSVSTGNTSLLKVAIYEDEETKTNLEEVSIAIRKGRNPGNISIATNGSNNVRNKLFQFMPLYSMYVPGISGIPIAETLVTRAILRGAVARGDANMYVRNIIYYIKEDGKLEELNDWLNSVFPNIHIDIPFNPDTDINVIVNMRVVTEEGEQINLPIEQCGTGLLQIMQIMAYVIYFEPQLLLLDEPDEHLHPDNQRILATLLEKLAEEKNIQIILCTHSRHLLSALSDEGKVIWMKNGQICDIDVSPNAYEILLDIGALDKFDECVGGKYKCVFLTEDSDTSMCNIILECNGFKDTLVFPFKGCGNIETVLMLADFIHAVNPDCQIVVHRDRDFLLDKEVDDICKNISSNKIIPFVTEQSDMEAYFLNPKHLSQVLELTEEEIKMWIEELIQNNMEEIIIDYSNKRNEAKKNRIYKKKVNPEKWVDAKTLLKVARANNAGKIPVDVVKGKYLKKKLNESMYKRYGFEKSIFVASGYLESEALKAISSKIHETT